MTIGKDTAVDFTAARTRERVANFNGLSEGAIPDGYKGLDWFRLSVVADPTSGDSYALNQAPQIWGFIRPHGTFDIESLTLDHSNRPHPVVVVYGYRDNHVVEQQIVTLSRSGPTIVQLDWSNIEAVNFATNQRVSVGLDDVKFTLRETTDSTEAVRASVFGDDSAHHSDAISFAHAHNDALLVPHLV